MSLWGGLNGSENVRSQTREVREVTSSARCDNLLQGGGYTPIKFHPHTRWRQGLRLKTSTLRLLGLADWGEKGLIRTWLSKESISFGASCTRAARRAAIGSVFASPWNKKSTPLISLVLAEGKLRRHTDHNVTCIIAYTPSLFVKVGSNVTGIIAYTPSLFVKSRSKNELFRKELRDRPYVQFLKFWAETW